MSQKEDTMTTNKVNITLRQAKEAVRTMGGQLRRNEFNEFVIRFKQADGTVTEYFGGDLTDALETACAITGTTYQTLGVQ